MNKKGVLWTLIGSLALMIGLVVLDSSKNGKMENLLDKKEPTTNWKWEDNWKMPNGVPSTPKEQPKPVAPQATPKVVAQNYNDAIQKSVESGKPILIFFTAEWCNWCKKMKSETIPNEKVQDSLKNYVFLIVDADKERDLAKNYKVSSLPTVVVAGSDGKKIRSDSGFKDVATFSKWLEMPNEPQNGMRVPFIN